jgi:predicted TPR repeat methyltransferase
MDRAPDDTSEDDSVSGQAERDTAYLAAIEADLDKARDLLITGQREQALDLCVSILDREDLPMTSACTLSLMMRDLGQIQAADQIRAIVLDALRKAGGSRDESPETLLSRAELFTDLEARDEAEALCRLVVEIAPDEVRGVNALVTFLAFNQRADEARAVAESFCDRIGNEFEVFMYFATIFGHLNESGIVIDFLNRAQERCKTKTQQAQLDYLRAAHGGDAANLDQSGMAVEVFDGFAASYDTLLAKIRNNGPNMIFTCLQEIGLSKTPTRRILDAGCGTGLCAGFLRVYAREIVGVDLSVKMLEKARDKQVYEYLARTDLSKPETYPDGPFDMIVCADVLGYFGALDTVLKNFHTVLAPGGWLLLTVETETNEDMKTGFKLYGSGRYKHLDSYLVDTATKTGFSSPRLLEHARLRNEMSKPVLGTVLAVQKPDMPSV